MIHSDESDEEPQQKKPKGEPTDSELPDSQMQRFFRGLGLEGDYDDVSSETLSDAVESASDRGDGQSTTCLCPANPDPGSFPPPGGLERLERPEATIVVHAWTQKTDVEVYVARPRWRTVISIHHGSAVLQQNG